MVLAMIICHEILMVIVYYLSFLEKAPMFLLWLGCEAVKGKKKK